MGETAGARAAGTAGGAATRRTNARGAARREALIDAAVRLFSERGFRGTGIIGLAREVGVTHVGLLHHFGTKEQLLHSVVATRDSQYAEMVRAVASRRGLEALATVRNVGEQIAAEQTFSRLFTVLIGENLQPDDPLNDYFRHRYRELRGHIEEAVRTGQEDGTIRADVSPASVAADVVAFLLGAQVEYLLDPEQIELQTTFDDYTRRLVASLAAD